jgi:hypothetical protein
MLAVSVSGIGLAIVAVILLVFMACIAIGALTAAAKLIRMGRLGLVFGVATGLLGVFAAFVTVSGFASIGNVARQYDPYRHYQERVITVDSAHENIETVCQRWRPTWLPSDCVARIHEHNRAVDLDHLQFGDKLYLDINIGHKNKGNDERTEIDYKKQTIAVSSQFPTMSVICNRWRPTWKIARCADRLSSYNRLPKFAKLTIGQRIELPVDAS